MRFRRTAIMVMAPANAREANTREKGASALFEHAIRAIQGGRNYQEDAATLWPGDTLSGPPPAALPAGAGSLIAVLADGMGGHVAGSVASQAICSAFLRAYLAVGGDAPERLEAALYAGNDEISQKVFADASLAGMGATTVGVAIGSFGLHWISVGDSPLYLWRAGKVEQLNDDHSLGGMLDALAERGEISASTAKSDPRRHLLRSAVTGGKIDLMDRSQTPLPLQPGDIILIASDGIETLQTREIGAIVNSFYDHGAAAVADGLIAGVEAASHPHQDNTTVVTVKVIGETAV